MRWLLKPVLELHVAARFAGLFEQYRVPSAPQSFFADSGPATIGTGLLLRRRALLAERLQSLSPASRRQMLEEVEQVAVPMQLGRHVEHKVQVAKLALQLALMDSAPSRQQLQTSRCALGHSLLGQLTPADVARAHTVSAVMVEAAAMHARLLMATVPEVSAWQRTQWIFLETAYWLGTATGSAVRVNSFFQGFAGETQDDTTLTDSRSQEAFSSPAGPSVGSESTWPRDPAMNDHAAVGLITPVEAFVLAANLPWQDRNNYHTHILWHFLSPLLHSLQGREAAKTARLCFPTAGNELALAAAVVSGVQQLLRSDPSSLSRQRARAHAPLLASLAGHVAPVSVADGEFWQSLLAEQATPPEPEPSLWQVTTPNVEILIETAEQQIQGSRPDLRIDGFVLLLLARFTRAMMESPKARFAAHLNIMRMSPPSEGGLLITLHALTECMHSLLTLGEPQKVEATIACLEAYAKRAQAGGPKLAAAHQSWAVPFIDQFDNHFDRIIPVRVKLAASKRIPGPDINVQGSRHGSG